MSRTITIDDCVADFIEQGARAYGLYVKDRESAIRLYVDIVCSEYIAWRLTKLMGADELKKRVGEDNNKLYELAIEYMRNISIDFEEGEKVDPTWTKPEDLQHLIDEDRRLREKKLKDDEQRELC